MIRFLTPILLILSLSFLTSCGGDAEISGTGHGGEAIIIGTAHTDDGSPAANVMITLAPADFSAVESDITELYKVKTDGKGNFTLLVKESGIFTLSGQNDSLFLYRDKIEVEPDSENTLGAVSFTKGTEITVIPWWEESSTNEISVTGTPWIFQLTDSANTITLPEEELSFIRYEDNTPSDSITLDLKETKVIGKDKLMGTGTIQVPSKVHTGEEFELTIEPFTEHDKYLVDWGDKEKDICDDGDLVHSYTKAGIFFIMIYKKRESGEFSKIPVDLSEIIVTNP